MSPLTDNILPLFINEGNFVADLWPYEKKIFKSLFGKLDEIPTCLLLHYETIVLILLLVIVRQG